MIFISANPTYPLNLHNKFNLSDKQKNYRKNYGKRIWKNVVGARMVEGFEQN